jgi:hypothetical protein
MPLITGLPEFVALLKFSSFQWPTVDISQHFKGQMGFYSFQSTKRLGHHSRSEVFAGCLVTLPHLLAGP